MTDLLARMGKGRRCIEEAQARGEDTSAWESHLAQLEIALARVERVAGRLQEALSDKSKELALRRSDLTYPYYAEDEWTKEQVAHLEGHIGEIERYLSEGGKLNLPRCCKRPEHICLIAVQGFTSCIMTPEDCGFSL